MSLALPVLFVLQFWERPQWCLNRGDCDQYSTVELGRPPQWCTLMIEAVGLLVLLAGVLVKASCLSLKRYLHLGDASVSQPGMRACSYCSVLRSYCSGTSALLLLQYVYICSARNYLVQYTH